MSETIHVLPLNDLKPHTESVACRCVPSVENIEEGVVIVHNAYDGREFFEDEEAFDEIGQ